MGRGRHGWVWLLYPATWFGGAILLENIRIGTFRFQGDWPFGIAFWGSILATELVHHAVLKRQRETATEVLRDIQRGATPDTIAPRFGAEDQER